MSLERIMVCPDLHAPYHDERAYALMLKVARHWRPRGLVQIGDLGDCYQISAYGKDPSREAGFEEEIKGIRKARAKLDSIDSLRWKRITLGNHDHRIETYVQTKAPEIFGLVNVDTLYQLSDNGWKVTPYRDHTKVGKIYFTHDVGSGGKFATNTAGEVFGHSIVIGHHHAIQMFVLGNALNERWVATQFGWLGDINFAEYEHRIKKMRQWSLGFGVGVHDTQTGHVTFQPVPIIRYTAEVGGRVYKG